MKLFIALIFSAALLSGCNIHANPGHAKVEVPGGVTIETSGSSSSGKFCPPGQAKKGNC